MGIHFQHARVLRFLFEVVHWVSGCEKEATTPLVFRSSLFQFLSVKKRPFSVRYPKQLIGVSLRPTNEKTVFLTEITHLTVLDGMRKTFF